MATGAEEPRIYEFGPFRLDPAERRFHRDGQAVPLTPKAFDLLVYLVARHGRLVEKQTLIAALWPDTVVEEANLAYNISALRKVLDDNDATSLIETVPTRGYRFVGQVTDGSTTSSGPIQALHQRKPGLVTSGLVLVALVAAGCWALVSWRTRVQPLVAAEPIARDLTRLTFEPGLQTGPSWSPNGRSIAYASDKTGNFDIWVRRIDDENAVQLTKSSAHDTQPAWSPDGESIVFRSERDGGGLFIVPAVGGPERRLTSFGQRPKWSPDGSLILFGSTARLYEAEQYLPRLFVVRPDGTAPREVLSQVIRRFHHMEDWNWDPKSQEVSVMGGSDAQGWGIFTIALSGGVPRLLNEAEGTGDWRSFEWGPSGTAVYVKSFSHLTTNVLKLTVDPAAMKTSRVERVTASDSLDVKLASSRDGRRLAFTITKPRTRLWSFPFDSAAGRITGDAEPVTDPDATPLDFDLTRDGSRLAYELGHAGTERRQLWTTALRNKKHEQLTGDEQIRLMPTWSRDGSRLAYLWQRGPCTGPHVKALAVRRTDTHEEQLMMTPRSPGSSIGFPSDWSPDGRWILASTHNPPPSSLGLWPVAAAPHADMAVKVLTSDKDHDLWNGRYSPDGRWIAFTAVKRGGSGAIVFVMPSAGADRTQWTALTGNRGWSQEPKWSPDGKVVYYYYSDGPFWNIWAVRFDGDAGKPVGEPFQVTHFDSPSRQLSPDLSNTVIGVSAKRLVVPMMEQTGSIWMLDNMDR